MKANSRPVAETAINQVIGSQVSIPFFKDPQAFLQRFIGSAGSTRPGGMLIGADKMIEEIENNPEAFRGR